MHKIVYAQNRIVMPREVHAAVPTYPGWRGSYYIKDVMVIVIVILSTFIAN